MDHCREDQIYHAGGDGSPIHTGLAEVEAHENPLEFSGPSLTLREVSARIQSIIVSMSKLLCMLEKSDSHCCDSDSGIKI